MLESNIFYKDNKYGEQYGKFKIRQGTYLYIPLTSKKVIKKSFELYNPNNIFKIMYKKIILKLLYEKLYKYIYIDIENYSFNKNIARIVNSMENVKNISVYSGTPGEGCKYTLQIMDNNGDILGYCKIPRNNTSKKYILKEMENINYVNSLNLKKCISPKVIYFDGENNVLVQSSTNDLKKKGNKLEAIHIDFLSEIYAKTRKSKQIINTGFLDKLRELEGNVNNDILKRTIVFLKNSINKGELSEIEYCFAHRDFTPWNIREKNETLYVFDWELSAFSPIYYDLFHFIVFTEILVRKSNHKKIATKILNNNIIDKFEIKNNINKANRKNMFIIYLCDIIHFYSVLMKEDYKQNKIIITCINILDYI